MRTIDQINADIKALDSARAIERKRNRAYDRIQNEGGEGFETDESASMRYSDAAWALQQELFAATWTRDVFDARRASWNAGIAACKTQHDVVALQNRLGFNLSDLKKAKEMLGA